MNAFPARKQDEEERNTPEVEAAFEAVPEGVCEVISPSTQAIDRGKKMRMYRREGVEYLWFVDPAAQMVEVFRLDNERWSHLDTYEGDIRARLEPFEAIEIDIGAFWAR
ncbi:Uma2 family endonuclease [Polyangium fumosum]|uniref:Uma2 family endonuclease n=1 Tax=Polyangium fumosum TaxID=889272 RepID=A0A4U1IYY6_9BACT|nr:Uma2 family endonuclease [Polyangium fumosum]TKC99904.1 Uma2 family endonuclease [Polyangium fumosum]